MKLTKRLLCEMAVELTFENVCPSGNVLRLRVRGSGYYAQKKGVAGADGDARLVVCGGTPLVEGFFLFSRFVFYVADGDA